MMKYSTACQLSPQKLKEIIARNQSVLDQLKVAKTECKICDLKANVNGMVEQLRKFFIERDRILAALTAAGPELAKVKTQIEGMATVVSSVDMHAARTKFAINVRKRKEIMCEVDDKTAQIVCILEQLGPNLKLISRYADDLSKITHLSGDLSA